ncbi:hypothetical protein GDO81_025253 [Engystomops pustulosus]|uniref:Taste receptor type 2 n=1 Tax=Engystomops pustulosus TaxID=76066 RepID=A0AAV6ZH52_ENGPU|nr:hypothetical protein GDO81_025253 [Engystomops pustulosus]
MTSSSNLVLIVDLISILITIPGYMFIIVVNILDWAKNKRLDVSDQLISGISLLVVVHRIQYACHSATCKFNETTNTLCGIHLLYLSLIFCTLLFSTWLAIHFCLKIVNINHKLYIYIQSMFPKMFPWILLPSILASVLVSVSSALEISRNSTSVLQNFSHFFPFSMFSSLCFLMLFSSALNIILSLQRHIRQMQTKTIEFRSQGNFLRGIEP